MFNSSSSEISSNVSEQELQEQLARAYYLLAAQEMNYRSHYLSMERLVSQLRIVAARVEAFQTGKRTSLTQGLVCGMEITQKVPDERLIAYSADHSFLDPVQSSPACCTIQQPFNALNSYNQNVCQIRDSNPDNERAEAVSPHGAHKTCLPVSVLMPNKTQVLSSCAYACSVASDYADASNLTIVPREVYSNPDNMANEILDIARADFSTLRLSSDARSELRSFPQERYRKQELALRQTCTPSCVSTVYAIPGTTSDHVTKENTSFDALTDSVNLKALSLKKGELTEPRVPAPKRLPVCLPSQLQKDEAAVSNSMVVVQARAREGHDSLPKATSEGRPVDNSTTTSSIEALHPELRGKRQLFDRDGELELEGTDSLACAYHPGMDRSRAGFFQPSRLSLQHDLCTGHGSVSASASIRDVADLAESPNSSRKRTVSCPFQGLTGPLLRLTPQSSIPGEAVAQAGGEERSTFCVSLKTVADVAQHGTSNDKITPDFVFWPGFQISNFFLPVEVVTYLNSRSCDDAWRLARALSQQGRSLTAILSARFPPYITQLTPNRVKAFYSTLCESHFGLVRSRDSGSPPILSEEEEIWLSHDRSLRQRAVDVAATLLTLLPPVLQALHCAASLRLECLFEPNHATTDLRGVDAQASNAQQGCFESSQLFSDTERTHPGGKRRAISCWRRYWCRRLYGLLHETRCGLEMVHQFDNRWRSTFPRLMEQEADSIRAVGWCGGGPTFSGVGASVGDGLSIPSIFQPETGCMSTALRISRFDFESCRAFLDHLTARTCFPLVLSALTEDEDTDQQGRVERESIDSEWKSISTVRGAATGTAAASADAPHPSLYISKLLCATDDLAASYERDILQEEMPARVDVGVLQSDLLYFDSLM